MITYFSVDEDGNFNYIMANENSLFELVGKRVSLSFRSDSDAITFRGFNITYTTFQGQFRVR